MVSLAIKNVLFTIFVPGTIALIMPLLIANHRINRSPTVFIVATPFFLLGLIVYFQCLFNFALFGRGTPAPMDAPKKLVVQGLFKYIRNPMYLGVILILLGWTILYQSRILLLYSLTVWLIFHLFVLLYEEPHLEKIFGDEYTSYKNATGRWLPKMRRREDSPKNREGER